MKHNIKPYVLLLAIMSMAACKNTTKEKKTVEIGSKENYRIISVNKNELGTSVKLPGVLEPFEFVQIYPKVNGFVKDMYVDRGSEVKKGQVLMRLQAPEIEERMSAAKLKYTEGHALYLTSRDRYQRMLETSKTPGTVSQFDLDAARTKMLADSATAAGEYASYQAQQDMDNYLTVTAPFDGVITQRNVHPGALVGPGTPGAKPMLILQQQSKLRLIINVPEEYAAQIADGDPVHFRVNAIPGKEFTGKVARSSGSLSSSFRSETVEVDVPNYKNNMFKAGMYAEVTLPVTGDENAFVVPKSAVVTTTERKYVVAVDKGHAEWVDVTEGNQQGDSTEVFGSFSPGEHIIANASYQIKNGATIN